MSKSKNNLVKELESQLRALKKLRNTVYGVVRRRMDEATRKNLVGKASIIAMEMGERKAYANGDLYRYSDGDFVVEWDTGGSNGTVFYKGHVVFQCSLSTIRCYVPGDWIEKFTEIFNIAYARQLQREITGLKREIDKMMADWGITNKDVVRHGSKED